MRKGWEKFGFFLGLLVVFWGFILLAPYGALAAEGGLSFLLVPFAAFGAGALTLVGTILGRRWSVSGAILLLVAGLAGLALPAAVIFFSPQLTVSFPTSFIAYVAVSWWAIPLVLLGGVTISAEGKAATEASL